jgi:hypothetical protein
MVDLCHAKEDVSISGHIGREVTKADAVSGSLTTGSRVLLQHIAVVFIQYVNLSSNGLTGISSKAFGRASSSAKLIRIAVYPWASQPQRVG